MADEKTTSAAKVSPTIPKVVLTTVIFYRNGKRMEVRPLKTAQKFTKDEIDAINEANPKALRDPENEDSGTAAKGTTPAATPTTPVSTKPEVGSKSEENPNTSTAAKSPAEDDDHL